MPALSYAVRCTFDDRDAMEAFLAWLRDPHVRDVCAAGAESAEIVRLDASADGSTWTIETRYRFASREAFARYEQGEAARLRTEGLAEIARLGVPAGGVTFTRTTGDVLPWK